MMTVSAILVLLAIMSTVAVAIGKCPVYVPLFTLCLIELIRVVPIGK